MQFFTKEWWAGAGDSETVQAYRKHYMSIRDRLPPDLVRVHDVYSLHDGRVRSIRVADRAGPLRIVIDTWDDDNVYRRLNLQYAGVSIFRAESTDGADLADPWTWGTFGYQELDAAGAMFTHRIIFVNDVELVLSFASFALVVEQGPL